MAKAMATGASATTEKKHSNLKPFQKGQSGNPKGRPPGSRNKITEDFLSAVAEDFGKHGVAVVQQVREEKPVAYLEMVAALVPKNVDLGVSADAGFLDLMKMISGGKVG